jgi:hypothetical protein
MSDNLPTVNRVKAIDMVANSSEGLDRLSPADRTTLEDAVEQDLNAASDRAARDEERLSKIEGQVHALSDAVIAIAEPSDVVDGAVRTVKDKM